MKLTEIRQNKPSVTPYWMEWAGFTLQEIKGVKTWVHPSGVSAPEDNVDKKIDAMKKISAMNALASRKAALDKKKHMPRYGGNSDAGDILQTWDKSPLNKDT